jgi:hypothetical protein
VARDSPRWIYRLRAALRRDSRRFLDDKLQPTSDHQLDLSARTPHWFAPFRLLPRRSLRAQKQMRAHTRTSRGIDSERVQRGNPSGRDRRPLRVVSYSVEASCLSTWLSVTQLLPAAAPSCGVRHRNSGIGSQEQSERPRPRPQRRAAPQAPRPPAAEAADTLGCLLHHPTRRINRVQTDPARAVHCKRYPAGTAAQAPESSPATHESGRRACTSSVKTRRRGRHDAGTARQRRHGRDARGSSLAAATMLRRPSAARGGFVRAVNSI